ncbi:MAG: glycoside hydrolase family 2 [Armatimonadetes bacterium]|nr:glycoside hydrolase family 2 [Armatimonadota bacterium]
MALALGTGLAAQSAQWAPVPGHIMTKWAKQVSPKNALPEYPRMQMVRKDWLNLNGLWDLAITKKEAARPSEFDKQILVPYPVESALSGVGHMIQPTERIWYKRTVDIPKAWSGKNVLLNFGAVDWDCVVYVNGKEVGKHTGGYSPFSIDITDALKKSGSQEIVLSVFDPTDAGQPHGKQVLNPGGIMYTGTSGIWQTVWLEPVVKSYIASYTAVPDIDKNELKVKVNSNKAFNTASVKIDALDGKKVVSTASGKPGEEITLKIKNPKLWSPDTPFLYDMKITLTDGKASDAITSYFGMRKISILKDENGINRLALNNKVLFQYGPLDQGFWPDGIYTAPTDEALRYDIEAMKKLGCNMMRKHVKIEPDRLYYWADRLGLLVWQDMPAGGNPPDMQANFERELNEMITSLESHPCIIMWVVFNEGWGQYDTPRLVDMVKKRDPSRLVNNASGWSDMRCGDVIDMHNYPGPGMPGVEPNRVAVLGEFGGLGRPIKDHVWKDSGSWGYVSFDDAAKATDAYVSLLTRMLPLIGKGLCAAVYTQTSDCEVEVNGMMTYDREVIKFDPTRSAEAAAKLYEPQIAPKIIVPSADQGVSIKWRYTTEKSADNWFAASFDDSSWKEGEAGFGTISRWATKWETNDIWIRRTFELSSLPAKPELNICHDEDAEVYINGELAATLPGYNSSYESFPLSPEKAKLLKIGKNTFAIHCTQTNGAQYIDCGISEPGEKK